MKELTHAGMKILRAEIDAALAQVAAKHDVQIKLGTGRFSAANASFKMEVATKTEEGMTLSSEVTAFKAQARIFGLDPEDFGKTFHSGGKTYTISGLVPRRPKFPVLANCLEDGKRYKFPAENVRAFLNLTKK